jgi:hypothetical protein
MSIQTHQLEQVNKLLQDCDAPALTEPVLVNGTA